MTTFNRLQRPKQQVPTSTTRLSAPLSLQSSRPFSAAIRPTTDAVSSSSQTQLIHSTGIGHSFENVSLFSPSRRSIHAKAIQKKEPNSVFDQHTRPHNISSATIQQAAQRGVRTPSSPLPYGDRIQQSFGRHEIHQIHAHLGPQATTSAIAMNASAFAQGNHVVFAGTPDLYTSAHEAAHVVQQRGGVHLAGGIGRRGDPYENHANAVAQRVTTGQSAEALLNLFAAPHGERPISSAANGAIQGSQMPIQMRDIRNIAGVLQGTYDNLGNLESDYKSAWDMEERKGFGISYHLINPRDTTAVIPNPKQNAVAHAHVSGNGKVIEGVSVKDGPGAAAPQWISPPNLHNSTATELIVLMNASNPSPQQVNNRRMVSRETGNWQLNSEPDDEAAANEKVFYHVGKTFIESKTRSPQWLYDAGTGTRIANIFTTANAAVAAIEKANVPRPIWANGNIDPVVVPVQPVAPVLEEEQPPVLEEIPPVPIPQKDTDPKTSRSKRKKKSASGKQTQAVARVSPPSNVPDTQLAAWWVWFAAILIALAGVGAFFLANSENK